MEMSPTIAELAKALCKAQAIMETAKKDSTNPHFNSKYADLASVWGACRKPITDNGLSVVQLPETDDHGRVSITTLLMHTSGEWVKGTISGAPKDTTNPQILVSICTYLRRAGLSAAVGIAPDDDDDGNAATGNKTDKKPETKAPPAAQTPVSPPSTGAEGDASAPPPEETEESVRKELMDECLALTGYTGMSFTEVVHAVTANREGKFGKTSLDEVKWTMKKKDGKDWSPLKAVLANAKKWREQEEAKGVEPGGTDVPV